MSRVEIPFVIQGLVEGEGDVPNLRAIAGANIQVNRRDGSAATVYTTESETNSATHTQPLVTNTTGRVEGWVPEGTYNLLISGPGISTYTQAWDATSAGNYSVNGDTAIGGVGPNRPSGMGSGEPGVGFGLNPTPDTYIYRTTAAEWRTNALARFDSEVRINDNRLVGSSTSFAVRDSASANIFRAQSVGGNFADNVSGVRTELGNGASANGILSGLNGVVLGRLGFAATGVVVANVAAGTLPAPAADKFRIDYAGGRDTLHLTSETGETGITFGDDVELYRRDDSVLSTPDTFEAAAYRVGTTALASTHLSDTANIGRLNANQTFTGANTFTGTISSNHATAGTNVFGVRVTGDAHARFVVTAAGGLAFGADGTATQDVHLGHGGADILRTPDSFQAGGVIVARQGTASAEITLGNVGPGSEPAVRLGDTTNGAVLYRSGNDMFRTPDSMTIDANLLFGGATQRGRITLPTGTTLADGISFGHSATAKTDRVDMFRSSAGVVTIDGNVVITGSVTSTTSSSTTTQSSEGALTGASGNVGQVTIGNVGGNATVFFGQANDATLYRDNAANRLRTPGDFVIDGTLTTGAQDASGLQTVNMATALPAVRTRLNSVDTWRVTSGGLLEWADGTGVYDTSLSRTGFATLRANGTFNAVTGYQVNGTALAASHLSNGTTGTGSVVLATNPTLSAVGVTGAATVGSVVSGLGSLTTNAFSFTSDPNTGMYSPGADQVALVTAGTARLTISATGAVNIPTSLTVGGTSVLLTSSVAGGVLTGTLGALAFNGSPITNAHIDAAAAIARSKLDFGVGLVNADISTAAAITDNKLAQITTANKVAASAVDVAIARLASPAFTGTPTVTGAAPALGTSTTQIATTEFVTSHRGGANPLMNGTVAVGTSNLWSRQDHVHPTDTSRAPLNNPSFTGSYIEANNITYYTRHTSGLFSVLRAYVGDAALPANANPRFEVDAYGSMLWRNGANPQVVTSNLLAGTDGFEFFVGEGTNRRLRLTTAGIGFFSATPVAQSTGWGSPTEVTSVGSRAVLSAASTLNDLIRHVSALEATLKAYGLLGT